MPQLNSFAGPLYLIESEQVSERCRMPVMNRWWNGVNPSKLLHPLYISHFLEAIQGRDLV